MIDSRSTEAGRSIRRRRECNACGKRFTTYEHIEQAGRLTVIKRDGSRVPFNREKVLAGLSKAAYKRPITAEAVERVADELEEALFQRGEREVESLEIGRLVMERLKGLDDVAYIRFASVYMPLRNLDDLLEQMREYLDSRPDPVNDAQPELF